MDAGDRVTQETKTEAVTEERSDVATSSHEKRDRNNC